MPSFTIERGTCHALYVYDVGASIDLERLRRLLAVGAKNTRLHHNRRALKYFDCRPAPLAIVLDVQPPSVAAFGTSRGVEVQVYDSGCVSITYRIPVTCGLQSLRELSCLLSEDKPPIPLWVNRIPLPIGPPSADRPEPLIRFGW